MQFSLSSFFQTVFILKNLLTYCIYVGGRPSESLKVSGCVEGQNSLSRQIISRMTFPESCCRQTTCNAMLMGRLEYEQLHKKLMYHLSTTDCDELGDADMHTQDY